MSEDASFSNYPSSYGEKNTRKSHFITIFFAILFAVVVLLVGLYFLGAYRKNQIQQRAPSQPSTATKQGTTPVPSVAPTATPTPVALKRSNLQVVILNGSGVAGAAGDTSTKLKNLGYTIKSTGNASKFDYTGITISITKDKQEYLDMLKKDLEEKGVTITTKIDDAIKSDAEVVVGK